MVRDVFSAKREEVRQRAAGLITKKLAADGIVVKEVMLRDVQLPPEYAKGLEALLLKEQENDRMGVETELKGKRVRIAELEAEAAKVQQVKRAEGDARVHVLQAKGRAAWRRRRGKKPPSRMLRRKRKLRRSTARPKANGESCWRTPRHRRK
jgi:regulator of protease activity HflC (stomatin/prohibitin superfamily)